jgi:hypothetical protein
VIPTPSIGINLLQADAMTVPDMSLANDLVELIHGPQKEIKEMFDL